MVLSLTGDGDQAGVTARSADACGHPPDTPLSGQRERPALPREPAATILGFWVQGETS